MFFANSAVNTQFNPIPNLIPNFSQYFYVLLADLRIYCELGSILQVFLKNTNKKYVTEYCV